MRGGDAEVGEREGGVGEPQAELVLHGDVIVIKVAIVDQESFFELGLPGVQMRGVFNGRDDGREVVV